MFDRKTSDIHSWVEERLSAYMDNQLAPVERAQLETHLRDCARCQASLESLRWTVSLLKQAPAPVLARSFTLPVTQKGSQASGFSFAFLRVATAMATLLLCLVLGLDFFSQFQFSAAPTSAAVVAPAGQVDEPTQNVALVPQATSAPPTIAAAATSAPRPPAAPQQPALQPIPPSPATRATSVGAAELQVTPAQADSAQKLSATVPIPSVESTLKTEGVRGSSTAPPAPRAAITATVTLPSPVPTQPAPSSPPVLRAVITATVTLPSPAPTRTLLDATNTPAAQARTQPTRDSSPRPTETMRGEFPTLRMLEIGLVAFVVVLGVLTIIAWRRK